jgi:hypothetical protein
LNLLADFRFESTDGPRLIFTMDIQSMYTNIPNAEGLKALSILLNQRRVQTPSTTTLLRLAELVLTLNTFEFNDQFYQQKGGVAMGTNMGPSYAWLFVRFVEQQMLSQYDQPIPTDLNRRFIDDIMGAASCERHVLDRFLAFVASFNPALGNRTAIP